MSKIIKNEDLVGKKFNTFTVVSVEEREDVRGRLLNCVCECGAEVSSTYSIIKQGVKQCDCSKRKTQQVEIGSTFNNLTVLSTDEQNSENVIVECSCGNKKSVFFNHLKNFRIKSCGCLTKSASAVGEVYNKYTISKDLPPKMYGKNYYKRVEAICECGSVRELCYRDLKREKIKSCGCDRKRHIEVGAVYNKWTILSEGTPRECKKGKTRTVNVLCECGNKKHNVAFESVYNGVSKSCGCDKIKKEKVEKYIEPIPTDTEDEKWTQAIGFEGILVSTKGRLFSTKSFNKYLKTENKSALDVGSVHNYINLNVAKTVYRSFCGEWDEDKYSLIPIDENCFNASLDNLFLARLTKSRDIWVTKAFQNMKSSGNPNGKGNRKKVRTITKRDIIEQYLKQGNLSTFLKLPMDFTGEHPLLSVSVDRIDNTLDYIPGNITLVTRFENMGRRNCDFETCMETLSHIVYNGALNSEY